LKVIVSPSFHTHTDLNALLKNASSDQKEWMDGGEGSVPGLRLQRRKNANLSTLRMHDLRHSFASAMVNSSMNLYDVKEILVHTNIKTTQRYAHLSNARLKKAVSSVVDYYEQCNV